MTGSELTKLSISFSLIIFLRRFRGFDLVVLLKIDPRDLAIICSSFSQVYDLSRNYLIFFEELGSFMNSSIARCSMLNLGYNLLLPNTIIPLVTSWLFLTFVTFCFNRSIVALRDYFVGRTKSVLYWVPCSI